MARFLHWSDLHREMSTADLPRPTAECPAGSIDAILINGDLNTKGRHLIDLALIHDAWKVPVVHVWGNHEAYGSCWQDLLAQEAEELASLQARGYDITVLHAGEKIISDTRILGTTLWTDFEILGNAKAHMFGAEYMMNDYTKIGFRHEDGRILKLRAADTLAMHAAQKEWLLASLARPFDGKTLVMTHHLPAPELLAKEARKSDYAAGYVSDLRSDFLEHKIDAWITGHTHWARRGLLEGNHGPIAFSSNMKGYDDQRPNFEPYRILDTQDPTLGLEYLTVVDPVLVREMDSPSPD